jgi:predicted ATPase
LDYRASAKLAEAEALTAAVAQIKNMEKVAAQIDRATGQWQSVQEQANQTANIVKQITACMTAEAKGFIEFIERASDNEKATLRLEVEKLRRAEGDWVQVLVRMLDHVYALHQGAVHSGQANVVNQVSQFQNACRDVARRVGLTPFTAVSAERFDAQRHRLMEGNGQQPRAIPSRENSFVTLWSAWSKTKKRSPVQLPRPSWQATRPWRAAGLESAGKPALIEHR